MSYPASVVLVCGDVTPSASCAGPIGAQWSAVANVNASAWVDYGSLGVCATGQFAAVNNLPTASWLMVTDYAGGIPAGGSCQPASNFAFGAGAAFTPPFDISYVDGPTLAVAWGIGFTMIGMSWFIGRCVGMVLSAVRSV